MSVVYGWGSNVAGQLGLAIELPSTPPVKKLDDDCDAAEKLEEAAKAAERRTQLSQLLTPHLLQVRRSVAQLACGESHTLALDRLGFVWTFGRNREVLLFLFVFRCSRRHVPALPCQPLGNGERKPGHSLALNAINFFEPFFCYITCMFTSLSNR